MKRKKIRYNAEVGCCMIPFIDRWYACPIESQFPDNQRAIQELGEQIGDGHIE